MFKRLSLLTSSILLATSVHADTTFLKSGVRVGVEGGYQHQRYDNKLNFKPNAAFVAADAESPSSSSTNNTGFIGVHIAYDYFGIADFINDYYASLNFNYRFAPGSAKSTIGFTGTNPALFNQSQVKIENSHQHDFGLDLHLGKPVTECFLVYGIAGLKLGYFKQKSSSTATTLRINSNTNSEFKFGYSFGLGARYGLNDGYSISAEFTFDRYNGMKSKEMFNPVVPAHAGSSLKTKSEKPTMYNAVLKFSKTF